VFRDGVKIASIGYPNPVVTTYTDTGVPDGSHTYTVAAYNQNGDGAESTPLTIDVGDSTSTSTSTTTSISPGTSTISLGPSAPTGLSATGSGTTVTLSWVNPPGDCGVGLPGPCGDDVFRDGVKIASIGYPNPVVTTYTDMNVPGGSHTYTVAAYNENGDGAESTALTIDIGGSTSPPPPTSSSGPSAPTGLSATVSGTTVTLSWVNPPGDCGIGLPGPCGDDVFRDGVKIASIGYPNPVVTTYTDTGVPDGSHTYTVAAYNENGDGAESTPLTIDVGGSTFSPPPTSSSGPSAPTGLSATVSGTTVTLSWVNPPGDCGVGLPGPCGDDVFRDGVKIASIGYPNPVVTTYTDTGVPDGSHTYTVAAYNQNGDGAESTALTIDVGDSTSASVADIW
jgi:hypothetical protein